MKLKPYTEKDLTECGHAFSFVNSAFGTKEANTKAIRIEIEVLNGIIQIHKNRIKNLKIWLKTNP